MGRSENECETVQVRVEKKYAIMETKKGFSPYVCEEVAFKVISNGCYLNLPKAQREVITTWISSLRKIILKQKQ